MEYRSKYKAEEIEAILDAKNNTGEGVDSNLDVLFTGQLQTKEVEVSEDTTITADEGFLGLKEVSVKVSGGGGSASSVEYLDVSGSSPVREVVIQFANLIKTEGIEVNYPGGGNSRLHIPKGIAPIGNLLQGVVGLDYEGFTIVLNSIKAVSIDFSTPVIMGEDTPIMTLNQIFSGAEEMLNAIPRLTEEQFYTL